MNDANNVFGSLPAPFSVDPMTGLRRIGDGLSGSGDRGIHGARARVTREFPGNSPRRIALPGRAATVILTALHAKVLESVPIEAPNLHTPGLA